MEAAGRNVRAEEGRHDDSGREQSPEKQSPKPPESESLLPPNCGETMVELQLSRKLGELFLCLVFEVFDTEMRENRVGADWDLGLMDFPYNLICQETISSTFSQNFVYKSSTPVNKSTQSLIITCAQCTNN